LRSLLRLSRVIDWINEHVGKTVYWLVVIAVAVSAANATSRYALNIGSNAWLELQWYLFSAVFLLCAGYTLLHNEHIRIDIIVGRFSDRVQAWIDLLGGVLFLLPMTLIIMWLGWPVFLESWNLGEVSSNAGGLIRWPVKLLMPIGFLLLTLQGVSEIIKRVAFLMGLIANPAEKHSAHGVQPLKENAPK
jgi:TRAP-type mannitol/chloroaromatic compound transport system permease small subunit